jgi:hypothetical protein
VKRDTKDGVAVLGIGCVMLVVYIIGWLLFIAAVCLIIRAVFFS